MEQCQGAGICEDWLMGEENMGWDTSESRDRRASPRFTALDPRGWIGWWAEGEFHEAEARLLDVSKLGASIEVDRLPPRDCPLFFSLGGSTTTESVEAEIVATHPGRLKKVLVRLAFSSRCPNRLFTAILHGPKAETSIGPVPSA